MPLTWGATLPPKLRLPVLSLVAQSTLHLQHAQPQPFKSGVKVQAGVQNHATAACMPVQALSNEQFLRMQSRAPEDVVLPSVLLKMLVLCDAWLKPRSAEVLTRLMPCRQVWR